MSDTSRALVSLLLQVATGEFDRTGPSWTTRSPPTIVMTRPEKWCQPHRRTPDDTLLRAGVLIHHGDMRIWLCGVRGSPSITGPLPSQQQSKE
jgi:hypothetical protein